MSWGTGWGGVAAVGVGVAVSLLVGGSARLPGVAGGRAGLRWPLLSRLLWHLRRGRRREQAGLRVVDLCDELVADLGAGLAPSTALGVVAERWHDLVPAAAAVRLGGSVPAALREVAHSPGAGDLRLLAAAWDVAERSGSALATAVDAVASVVRERERTRRLVRSELASARSTARLLAALPLATLLIGSGAGGSPLGFLLGTPAGWGCLLGGLTLQGLGLLWIERIADGIERDT